MKGESPSSPFDLLIVGGGPCGTAAAWRAHELGLSVLVVDRDSVLSIVKEWGEHQPPKNVDADYGDMTDLVFPPGGALVSQLPYEDQTPANQLYERWLKVYDDNQIAYRNGVELGGCERLPDGTLAAECMELQTQAKSKVYAKNILLALGSGSPAKVRVMGDGLGIRYKLGNSEDYVGAPACVVGGGMSAAEAVVAIALAKNKAKDNSDVFWCYRGRGMPKVAQGKALASKFYEAWTGGNIRYLPLSEPLAVFKDDSGKDLVAVRTRRVVQQNQPPELVCYEFEKKQVLAFIGSERPTELLGSIGIREFELADAPAKKRLAVTALHESQVPNVFMAGGLLHPAYLQTNDFRPEALQSTLKEYSTCFKLAMIEGVAIVETIKKRLEGGSDDKIREDLLRLNQTLVQPPKAQSAPPAAPAPQPVAAEPQMGAAFVQIGPGEAATKREHFFTLGDNVVGRSAGRVVVGGDALLRDQHAAFRIEPDECYVLNTPFGGECYVRINSERTVPTGTLLVAGRQRLRVDVVDGKVCLSRLDAQGQVVRSLPLARDERSVGRDDLDPRDFALSRSHLSAADAGGLARVRDTSRNGTFVELKGSLRLNEGDEVWMGEQRFRFVEMRSELPGAVGTAVVSTASAAAPAASQTQTILRTPAPSAAPSSPSIAVAQAPAPAPAPSAPAASAPAAAPAPAAPPAAAPTGDPAIVLPDGTSIAAGKDKPMLSYLAEAGAATDDANCIGGNCQTVWECWDPNEPEESGGSCGKCIVTILDGAAALSEASSREKNTIKKANKKLGGKLDEAACRLACQARVLGPVKIQPKGK